MHRAARREMFSNQVEKFELICRQPTVPEKAGKGLFCCLAIEADKRAYEAAHTTFGMNGGKSGFSNPRLQK